MKKKKAFSLTELMIVILIMPIIIFSAFAIMQSASSQMYTSQVESTNRNRAYSSIYYITREIESAQYIKVSEKTLEICQTGSVSMDKYELADGKLKYNDRKIQDVDVSQSGFSRDGRCVLITLCLLQNDIETKQVPKTISFRSYVRSEAAVIEEG